MRKKMLAAVLRPVAVMTAALVTTLAAADGQVPSVAHPGKGLIGTWNMQVQWVTCEDGSPQLLPTPDLRTFAPGGVMTEIDSSIWCDAENGHCTSLGTWEHGSGRKYVSRHKRLRLSPNSATGYIIVTSQIRHEDDDRLSTTETLRFYDDVGALAATRCRTAVGTRLSSKY